jgi:hypothetical protein
MPSVSLSHTCSIVSRHSLPLTDGRWRKNKHLLEALCFLYTPFIIPEFQDPQISPKKYDVRVWTEFV